MDYRHSHPEQDHSPTYRRLKAMPKVELHRHLEGSLRLGTMLDIAREYGLALPGGSAAALWRFVQMTPRDAPNADIFISKFGALRPFYRSREVIERVAYETVLDAAADNIVYLELHFTPVALAAQMGFPLTDVAGWVLGAVERASRETGVQVRGIVSMNRHEPVELGEQQVEVAIAHMDRGVVGVDLAGSENAYPGAPFARAFRRAREAGLCVTVHAGEWAGPASVVEAVEVLGAARLGHGVRVLEGAGALALAQERGIVFEVCPTSNVQSGVAPSYRAHPLPRMVQAGLCVTLNTDDPSISGIDLTDEYVHAVEEMGVALEELERSVLDGARAAFLPPGEREALVERVQAALDERGS